MKESLKITSVDIYKSDIELIEPFRIAIMEIRSAKSVFIKINTNEGIYGFGEANPTWGITGETQSISLAAAAHLVSARSNIQYADLDGYLVLKEDPVVGGAQYNVGEINLPDTPGHGADVDPDFLEQCELATINS